nr:hypothetical protein BaRGS_000030 [Batillaria attramentaria]
MFSAQLCAAGFVRLGLVTGQAPDVNQATVDNLAQSLDLQWHVVTNVREIEAFDATLTISNTGSLSLQYGNWTIFFYCVYPMEPTKLSPGVSYEVPDQGVKVMQVNGMLYKMWPTDNFRPLQPGDKRVLRFHMQYWSVSRTDNFPNWYIVGSQGTQARIIASTGGDDPMFVAPFSTVQQQKRYDFDEYPAPSAQQRYERSYVPFGPESDRLRIVPKPASFTHHDGRYVTLSSTWKIYDESPAATNLSNEVSFLRDKLAAFSVTPTTGQKPSTDVIILTTGEIAIDNPHVLNQSDDAYSLTVDDVTNTIRIIGRGASGVFYGLQSLLSLLRSDGAVPAVDIYDAPRFEFRGLFLDISRNFRTPAEIEKLVDAMAVYKLNKLHLHLADDEGWRIEISGLPELTQIGSHRCHDPEENECLLPQLGSGPFSNNSGSGFLSVTDYQSILTKAVSRHVEVIPEIDSPGHSRAAIKAMELRYRNYTNQSNLQEAERYRLIEEGDPSVYTTPQFFNDNAINVCIESTYRFITKVVSEIRKLHETIQPLREFHYGGDEVGRGAWVNSTNCQQLQERDVIANTSLKQYFFMRVANITHAQGLALGAWEDGLMVQGNTPFNRSLAENEDVFANVWDNVWEWGPAARTHNLANMGYKVIMSHGTSMYFDHPYEPHPEERGYYWATRFTDTQKTFGFMPMAYYENIEERRSGEPLTREEVCGMNDENCPPLEKAGNIVGMQGQLWSETIRTRDHMESQYFPRVLGLAERAWHYADWETDMNVTTRTLDKMADWYSFARAVGYRELPRLDEMGINYRIPPPGAKVEKRRLFVSPGFPGLTVEYSRDNGVTWFVADGTERIREDDPILLRTRSADGQRYSRTVELQPVQKPLPTSQSLLNYIGDHVTVKFEVVDNYLTYGIDYYVASITLNNTGSRPVPEGNWAIYFPSVQWVEPDMLKDGREHVMAEYRMALSHDMGYLFRLAPVNGFPTLESGQSREITFKIQYWSASRYEQFPNYFVAADGANTRVINNTATESLDFVADFTKVNQWKRDSTDRLDPFTPSARYGRQSDVNDFGYAPHPYLPTPLSYTMDRSHSVSMKMGWVIAASTELNNVATFLKDTLANISSADLTIQQTAPARRFVQLQLVSDSGVPHSYNMSVRTEQEAVTITGNTETGVLYGVQSLINMAMQSPDGATVMEMKSSDAPRFSYRGMHVDVSRNFHSKASLLKLLEVMGLYKLNVLHLHLADDEGWRLEIPGMPELTTVGSTRCYDPTEERCLTPVMGSGPDPDNPGTGFYSVQDYREILQHAARRHIEVIPEFDMPGHSRAAVKAMTLRRKLKTEAGDEQAAHEYALDEEGDQSLYSSVQFYDDDAVNPCMNSTFAFIRHVMTEVRKMHDGVNPLKTYHFGGDEVAAGAWIGSRACQPYVARGDNLKKLFSTRVAEVASELGLNIQAWEDGLMLNAKNPIPVGDLATQHVYVNAWDNVWEWGAAHRPYTMANRGYKVIMGPVTHTYFDHPYEPDPEERGFYWGTRYTDTRKTFHFQPAHLWHNVAITRFGAPITLDEICGEDNSGCPKLKDSSRENIIGMQGHVWSETVRTAEQLDYMIFPRLLALAERAWHEAPWEGQDAAGAIDRVKDWRKFANTLGHAQLSVLDRLNVAYRVPPPGAELANGKVSVNVAFPGLTVEYSVNEADTWSAVPAGGLAVKDKTTVHLRTKSADGLRSSRTISMAITDPQVHTGDLGTSYRGLGVGRGIA